MYWFLSQNWSGLVVAIACALLGGILSFLGDGLSVGGVTAVVLSGAGISVLVLAAVLFIGAAFHLFAVKRYLRRYPPPGRLVDVGGYYLHIMAEGDGATPVIWIPGSHDQGLAFHHLHSVLSGTTRSILYDRAGCGWSDVGPFPRTVSREVDELHALLQGAGESGPFVIVAHSLGGFVAQNFASRYPDQVAGLVLLDSSSVDASTFTSRMKENRIPGFGMKMWAFSAFGLAWFIVAHMLRGQPDWLNIYDVEVRRPVIQGNCQPKLPVGFMAALEAVFDNPFDLIRGRGVLGDIPLFAVIPPISERRQIQEARTKLPNFSERQVRNFVRLLIDAQHQVAKMSWRGEVHYAPADTTHSFPFEAPEATLDEVRAMLSLVDNASRIRCAKDVE